MLNQRPCPRCYTLVTPYSNATYLLIFLLSVLLIETTYAQNPFITTWKTDNPGTSDDNQVTIPTDGGGYNYTVDWGKATLTPG